MLGGPTLPSDWLNYQFSKLTVHMVVTRARYPAKFEGPENTFNRFRFHKTAFVDFRAMTGQICDL